MSAPTADFSMNNHAITNLTDPSSAQDAATKNYVDSNFYADTTTLDLITAPTASVSLNSQLITNLADPSSAQDAATKNYIDSNFYADTTTLDQITAPTASLSMNSQKITNLAPGTNSGDALTVGQSPGLSYGMMYNASNITSISYPFVVPFASIYTPSPPAGVTNNTALLSNGVIQV